VHDFDEGRWRVTVKCRGVVIGLAVGDDDQLEAVHAEVWAEGVGEEAGGLSHAMSSRIRRKALSIAIVLKQLYNTLVNL